MIGCGSCLRYPFLSTQKWGGKRPQTEGKKGKGKRKEKEVPGFQLVDSMEADDVLCSV
jgi:hypothetical protein